MPQTPTTTNKLSELFQSLAAPVDPALAANGHNAMVAALAHGWPLREILNLQNAIDMVQKRHDHTSGALHFLTRLLDEYEAAGAKVLLPHSSNYAQRLFGAPSHIRRAFFGTASADFEQELADVLCVAVESLHRESPAVFVDQNFAYKKPPTGLSVLVGDAHAGQPPTVITHVDPRIRPEVSTKAATPQINVTNQVQPAAVQVEVTLPKRVSETVVERDAGRNIIRSVTTERDAESTK